MLNLCGKMKPCSRNVSVLSYLTTCMDTQLEGLGAPYRAEARL